MGRKKKEDVGVEDHIAPRDVKEAETVQKESVETVIGDSDIDPKEKEKVTVENQNQKVQAILQKAKEKGTITYGELATELGDANAEQIDQVFDAFEKFGVDVLKDELEEPDVEELEQV